MNPSVPLSHSLLNADGSPEVGCRRVKCINKSIALRGWVWIYACNPSTLGGGWITRSGDQDHPGQHGETPSLLKIQKLAGHGGACLLFFDCLITAILTGVRWYLT